MDSDEPRKSVEDNHRQTVAWCGWGVPAPDDWQPLKIEGGWVKGSMMLGTDGAPVVMIKWWRPDGKRFDAARWMNRRFKALGALPDANAPSPHDFRPVQWIVNMQYKKDVGKTIWCGYAPDSGLVVECISTSAVDDSRRESFFKSQLPRLTATPRANPVDWAIFSTSFTTPPGYRLTEYRLVLGDIALELRNDTGHRAILRQVFPAGLALQRRGLDQWLDTPPFMERRRLRVDQSGESNAELYQQGWKRLPAPLGRLKPRYCTRIARIANDRLYIAETQAGTVMLPDMAKESMLSMAGVPIAE